jgi:hypothetical protein
MSNYNLPFIRAKLVMALTEQDRHEAKGKRYNPYALGIYFQALEEWMQDPRTPVEPFDTLADYFTTCYDARKEFSLRKLDRVVRELRVDPRAMKQGLTT